ncbi:MAG: 4Fe-4S dicluster domain-containing protein [Anaerolineales bacterium]|nr:4Fe-4S dicluster domain-containing protein [Anaerolineales bacterium]
MEAITASQNFIDEIIASTPDGQRLRLCLQCGACSGVCPFGFIMTYPPHGMIAALRAGMLEEIIDADTGWMCVSCYACTQVCPAKIPVTAGLTTRVKEEMILEGNVPTELQDALEKAQRYFNPLGESPRKRAEWTKNVKPEIPIMGKAKEPVEVLWFVGDYASYHPRVIPSTQSLAKILNTLEVDYGILGPEEVSDGDSLRLAGESGLYEMLAEKNAQAFEKYEFNEIITSDPHAYNAIKNEYPHLDISYPVRHYTEFLAERLDKIESLLKNEIEATVVFHDPCYLGRVNGVFEEPRQLLGAIPGVELMEMSHNRENSLCCGGGGGGMWLDGFQWEKANVRISDWRVREAVSALGSQNRGDPEESKTSILAVACPYEAPRFEDSTKTVPDAGDILVKDISELLAEAMDL